MPISPAIPLPPAILPWLPVAICLLTLGGTIPVAAVEPSGDPLIQSAPEDASDTSPQTASTEVRQSSAGDTDSSDAPQEPARFILPKTQHRWAKYQPGAWREVRVSTETLHGGGENTEGTDRKGLSLSITTQLEVLKAINQDRYQLEVQATVNVEGKRIVGEWQTRSLDMITNHRARVTRAARLEKRDVQIGAQTISCDHWQLEAIDQQRKLTFDLFYASETPPHLLKTQLAETPDSPDGSSRWIQTSQVVAPTVPFPVCGKTVPCHCLRVVQKSNKGSMVQVAFHAETVPGGVVAAWSTDTNIEGEPIRWSRLEVVDYGFDR